MEVREEEAATAAHEDVPEDIQMPREILTYDKDGTLRKYVATIKNPLLKSNNTEHPLELPSDWFFSYSMHLILDGL